MLQARALEWVAISFSNAWKWRGKVESFSRVWLLATPWTAAYAGSSVHGVLQARVLEWVATAFSKLSTYYVPNASGPRPHGAYLEPWLCLKSLCPSCPEWLLPLNWNDPCKAPCAEPWAKCPRNVGIRNLNLKILPSLKTELRILLCLQGNKRLPQPTLNQSEWEA